MHNNLKTRIHKQLEPYSKIDAFVSGTMTAMMVTLILLIQQTRYFSNDIYKLTTDRITLMQWVARENQARENQARESLVRKLQSEIIPEHFMRIDVVEPVRVLTKKSLLRLRKKMQQILSAPIPSNPILTDSFKGELAGKSEVMHLTVLLPKGMSSDAFWVKTAVSPVRKLMVICGLKPTTLAPQEKTFVDTLLARGIDVLFCPMPLSPDNLPASVQVSTSGSAPMFKIGEVDFVCDGTYAGLKGLDSKTFCSLQYFIEPVVQAVSFVCSHIDVHYEKIGLCGADEGAFMALLAGCVDTHFNAQYFIDAPMPFTDLNKNDYKRTICFFENTEEYITRYLMTVLGKNRKASFFHHKHNAKAPGILALTYASRMENLAKSKGLGSLQFFVESEEGTGLTPQISEKILQDFAP
ncbi:MAG: hypothetical protein LBH38_01525 [Holosporales bacterium]|jgi:hypothetical protein|nr:hypothetical protein [Holosporales bacterium]